jgi:hypothetical protein
MTAVEGWARPIGGSLAGSLLCFAEGRSKAPDRRRPRGSVCSRVCVLTVGARWARWIPWWGGGSWWLAVTRACLCARAATQMPPIGIATRVPIRQNPKPRYHNPTNPIQARGSPAFFFEKLQARKRVSPHTLPCDPATFGRVSCCLQSARLTRRDPSERHLPFFVSTVSLSTFFVFSIQNRCC